MRRVIHLDLFALGKDFMTAMLLIPLRDGRVLVHVLDNVSPTDAGVVGAEGDFALLRAVWDDAHLRAAEIVVEEVLEPHARDEEEVPAIGAPLLDVIFRAVAV